MMLTNAGGPANAIFVPWDTALAETDGIRSTAPYSVTGGDVPTGGAGIVPTGMAGLWRLTQTLVVVSDHAESAFGAEMIVNDFAIRFWSATNDFLAGRTIGCPITPIVVPLAEGDAVWSWVNGVGNSFVIGADSTDFYSTFLMEYLGPAPA
jgi:hypothetical protein